MASLEGDMSTTSSSLPTAAHPAATSQSTSNGPTPASTTDEPLHPSSASISSASDSDTSAASQARPKNQHLQRPQVGSRKSSGTIVVPRDTPRIELEDEEYESDDARTMSPRRSSEEIERMGEDARAALINQAKMLQASLLEVVERVETVRSEHEKLEGGNRFLQSYIGELMQTSKITSTGAAKSKTKGKGRSGR